MVQHIPFVGNCAWHIIIGAVCINLKQNTSFKETEMPSIIVQKPTALLERFFFEPTAKTVGY